MRVLIFLFLSIFSNIGFSNDIFKDLPNDVQFKVFDCLDDSTKCELRTYSKSLWKHFKPWTDDLVRQGLLVKKPIYKGILEKIRKLFQPVPSSSFVYLPDEIQNSSIKDLRWLWKQESIDAALSEFEPAYLKILSNLYGIEFARFTDNIAPSDGASKEEWIQHGQNVLLINSTVMDVAWSAARDAARGVAWSARDVAWYAASFAGYTAAGSVTWSAAWSAASSVTWSAAMNVAWSAARDVAKDAASHGSSPQDIDKISYRVTEKTILLYFIKSEYLGSAFEKFYNVVKEHEVSNYVNSPFASQAQWEAFKIKHFSHLNEDQIHFVQPMLDELDRIVEKVESLSGQSS